MNIKKYKSEERNEFSADYDYTKSIEYNLCSKLINKKNTKDKNDFKNQNFSQALNFMKSFDNRKSNLNIKKPEEKIFKVTNANPQIRDSKQNYSNEKRDKFFINAVNKVEINNVNESIKQLINENSNRKQNKNFKNNTYLTSTNKLSNTDSKEQKKQNFKDFDLRENLISKLENLEISEFSKCNAHFSREDDNVYYMKLEKNIEIKNNNILTKSHGYKHFSLANGPYKMDIKPMLGKIKEIQEYNFDNNFNVKLNLNDKRKSFASVNYDNLINLNLEKIENNLNLNNKEYVYTDDDLKNESNKNILIESRRNKNFVKSNQFLPNKHTLQNFGLQENLIIKEESFRDNIINLKNLEDDLEKIEILEELDLKDNDKALVSNRNTNTIDTDSDHQSNSKKKYNEDAYIQANINNKQLNNNGQTSTGCKTLKTNISNINKKESNNNIHNLSKIKN